VAALNLGSAGDAPAVEIPSDEIAWWGWVIGLAPVAASLLLTRLVPRYAPGRASWPGISLATLPGSAKLLILLYLIAIALTHLFAAGAIWQVTQVTFSGNPEYFRFAKPLHLFRMSHQHAFGHGTMYLLLGAIFLRTRVPEHLKVLGISLTSLGALADLVSWWLQKYAGPSFEPLSIFGGISFSIGFVLMTVLILKDLLKRS